MKELEEMSLYEIECIEDNTLVEWYNSELDLLQTNRIAKEVVERYYGKSIMDLIYKIAEEERKMTSDIFFSGDIIEMYPYIREQKARKPITCDFSAGIIRTGSLYISARPLLKDLNNGKTYVLKRTIKVEDGYWSELPTNIQELEDLYIRAETGRDDGRGIEYSHFLNSIGGTMTFQELKGRRRK